MPLIDTSERDNPINYLEARVEALVKRVKELENENTSLVQKIEELEGKLIAYKDNIELL